LRRRLNEGWTSVKNYLVPPYGDFRLSNLALAARTGQPVLVDRGLLGVIAPAIERQTSNYLSQIKSIDKSLIYEILPWSFCSTRGAKLNGNTATSLNLDY
jgi:hypothetical protein